MKKIIIFRGIPASGKSTKAKALKELADLAGQTSTIRSTDDQFMIDGKYCFNPKALGVFHQRNIDLVENDCLAEVNVIVVDNTNIKQSAINPYLAIAKKYGYGVTLMEVNTDLATCIARNNTRTPDRKVPEDVLHRMHEEMGRCSVKVG